MAKGAFGALTAYRLFGKQSSLGEAARRCFVHTAACQISHVVGPRQPHYSIDYINYYAAWLGRSQALNLADQRRVLLESRANIHIETNDSRLSIK
jgi:hypothetical protein